MSKRKRDYYYSRASSSSHGLMRCCVCGKSISAGEYRYHDTGDAYVTAHRDCTKDDPAWAKFDAEVAAYEQRRIELSDACKEFRAKWGVQELDEYILEDAP